ncbi:MAG: hypothetical protein JNK14_13025 [Chitinophagaceae bacterium]|nr:hypothetical protein [Chitinophagaceae bacterium]
MKKKILLTGLVSFFSVSIFAQIPEDVLKYSWQPVNGTARINAIGGAMGSLGGDLTATFVNPAGIAFFKTTDIVLSPGFSFLNNKSNFRGTGASDKTSFFNVGPTGIIGGWKGGNGWNNALSFAISNRSFSNNIFYTGQNDFSSGAEQYAAEVAGSGIPIDNIPFNNQVSFGSQMAVWNYLVDTTTLPGNNSPDVISLAMWDALKNGGQFLVKQSTTTETFGNFTDLALGFATNHNDKLYIGGSFGLPIVKYTKENTFREEDASGDNDNNFNFYELKETFTTKGIGINGKLGVIYKPAEFMRVGLAVHTPTWYSFEDSYDARMDVNLDNYRTTPGTTSVTVRELFNGNIPTYKYELVTPWKVILSGSYVIREIEDVRKQKGFLTADIEYVTYGSNKFRNAEDYDNDDYYNSVNDVMNKYYKGAFNFRVGGELKFTTMMGRLGFAYYGNPYKDKELKANRMFISGGLGYRNAGMFIDLTYAHGLHKDVNFPYRLPDKANTFATTKSSGGNISLTLGFKI